MSSTTAIARWPAPASPFGRAAQTSHRPIRGHRRHGLRLPGARQSAEILGTAGVRVATRSAPRRPTAGGPIWRTGPGPPKPTAARPRSAGSLPISSTIGAAHKLPPKQVAQADPLQFMLLEAADEALKDAGYRRQAGAGRRGRRGGHRVRRRFRLPVADGPAAPSTCSRSSPACCARRSLGESDRITRVQEQFATALLDHWPALIDETGSFSTSSLASRIGKTWDLDGRRGSHRRRRRLAGARWRLASTCCLPAIAT